jgi:predicted RNA-binding protein YlxR (DUF448 family)
MIPQRTCVGCGERGVQSSLRRFSLIGDGLVLDHGRERLGRGAYLHDASRCWDAFVRRRGPIRSLRASVPAPERARLISMLQRESERA